MDDFKIEKVIKKPEYSQKTMGKKRQFNPLWLLMLGTIAISLSGCDLFQFFGTHTEGLPISSYNSSSINDYMINNKEDFIKTVSEIFSNELSIEPIMETNVVLTNDTNIIQFEADEFFTTKNIYIEWIGNNSGYSNLTNESERLDTNEIAMISNYQFGSNYILVIDSDYYNVITNMVTEFIKFYQTNTNI